MTEKKKLVRLNLMIPEDLKEEIEYYAALDDRSVSAMVRVLLKIGLIYTKKKRDKINGKPIE